jgi:hypothetical protein
MAFGRTWHFTEHGVSQKTVKTGLKLPYFGLNLLISQITTFLWTIKQNSSRLDAGELYLKRNLKENNVRKKLTIFWV